MLCHVISLAENTPFQGVVDGVPKADSPKRGRSAVMSYCLVKEQLHRVTVDAFGMQEFMNLPHMLSVCLSCAMMLGTFRGAAIASEAFRSCKS